MALEKSVNGRVDRLMFPQVAFSVECPVAKIAHVGTLVQMDPHVHVQSRFLGKRFRTDETLGHSRRSGLQVGGVVLVAAVRPQQVVGRKRPAALVAQQ